MPAKRKTVSKKASVKKTVLEKEENIVEAKPKTTVKTTAEKIKKTPKEKVKKTEEVKTSVQMSAAKKADQVVAEVKAPAKKTTTKKTAAKTSVKKAEPVKAEVKKEPVKKVELVKTEEKEEPVKKAVSKKTTVKKAESVKKAPAKKATQKKTTTKKATIKKDKGVLKLEQYNNFALDTCIDMAKAMGVNLGYDDYANMLLSSSDVKAIAADLIKRYDLMSKGFVYEEDGFDVDVIEVLINKVAATVEVKAKDFIDMSSEADECIAFQLTDDVTNNNEEYHKEFDLVKRLLMLAQRKDLHSMAELEVFVKKDMTDLMVHYMNVAYDVMKNWQYDDVKYYENFIYAVLSQFTDLYEKYENRAMMDVADLYIIHGDYGLGDANYGYILRENSIKDYIYYRFANVYMDIDREKARSIAQSALQYVDGRFTYYPNIIQILEG